MLMSWITRIVFTSVLAILAIDAKAEDWAKKLFAETSHDFRTVGRGTKAEYHFELKNIYKEELHIASVRTSCGCTTPIVTKDTLKTHESGAVIAKFNTDTHIGDKSAVLTVVFDRPYYAEVQLTVRGHIRTDVTFTPPEVNYGETGEGEVKDQEVIITHTGASNWEIKDVRSHCGNLTVRLDPAQRTPGSVKYRMIVSMKGTMSAGDIRERLTLVTNDTRFPTIEMAVSGRVRPSLEVSPAAVGLGNVQVGQSIEKRLVIRADQEFAVSDVFCGDKRFTFEIPEGKKKLHFVKMTFKADDTPAQVAQKVRIVSDLNDGKFAECIVSGTITR
jgi:hypothetical protein